MEISGLNPAETKAFLNTIAHQLADIEQNAIHTQKKQDQEDQATRDRA